MTYRFKTTIAGLLLISAFVSHGQAPVITHIDKTKGATGERVTISGNNFGAAAADLDVYFGPSRATIQTVSNQLIEVTVPAGAAYDNITVTNHTTGLTAFSSHQFFLSYGGENPLATSNLVAQPDITAEPGLFDLCLCDLDNDGKNDIATSSDKAGTTAISILRNTSTPGTISFTTITQAISAQSVHVECGDLNGDGKKDLVISEGGSGGSLRLVILRNTSAGTITFAAPQYITLANKSPKRIKIMDLDLNGKPDLVVTDQRGGNSSLLVMPNTSTLGAISFGTAITLTIPFAGGDTDGLGVQDINGDGLADIVTTQFLEANSNVYIFENNSTPGNFRFGDPVTLTLTGSPINLRIGDLDNDARPDIAATQILNSSISIFLNESTTGDVKFSTAKLVATDPAPFGIDFGDLDGDGKLDVVVATLRGSAAGAQKLTLLNNNSTPGNVVFVKSDVTTPFINRHVTVGDLDGDGKADIAYASVDDTGAGVIASKVSFFRNKSCLVPQIAPGGPLIMCTSFPQALTASISAGATYQWQHNAAPIGGETSSTFTPPSVASAPSPYTVIMTSDGCAKTSAPVSVEVINAGSAPTPTVGSNSPVCAGSTLTLTATSAGATEYEWTGPAAFAATTASGNASRTNFEAAFAGRYDVNVKVGGCIAAKGSVVVEMTTLPTFRVDYPGSDVICSGDTKILSILPNDTNFTYQWFNGAGAISGATNATLSVNNSETYHYKATSTLFPPPACPVVSSDVVPIVVAALPAVAFTAPAEGCRDNPVTFTNQTTGLTPDAGGNYLWEFGDATTSTETNPPAHTYTTIQNFTVKLTASYRGNACPASVTHSINILAPPTASITTPTGIFEVCLGDSLKLEVNPAFAGYLWSNTKTTPSIFVKEGGNYSVQLTSAIGCRITPAKQVLTLLAPTITATAIPAQINIGQTTQLEATGADTYLWEPPESLNNPAIASPLATPAADTNYKVTGTSTQGCKASATVEVKVTFDNITNLLKPSNFLTPNGDTFNDLWMVGNILSFPQCDVKIYDEKGMKVYEAKPYINNWAGTHENKQLPNGVYYYFIQCDGEGKPKTGSITLIR